MQLDPIAPEETVEESAAAQPITFTIVGHRRDAKGRIKEESHDFTCLADAPYGEFLDFITAAGQPGALGRMYRYVVATLVDDDERERFDELLHSPGLRLNPQLLDLLASQLIEAYSERPTLSP